MKTPIITTAVIAHDQSRVKWGIMLREHGMCKLMAHLVSATQSPSVNSYR
jgi:hypothetical protein